MKRLLPVVILLVSIMAHEAHAAELKPIQLPAPQTDRGKPFMQALRDRASMREFSPQELPLATLSNLLWAAFGVNRPDSGKRTAPSAMDMREIDVYAATPAGLYVYDAGSHVLIPVSGKDIREVTGKQAFVREAPLNLIFVVDYSKMKSMSSADRDFYAAIDTGYISENVYLYCASEGLATVARGWFDRRELEKAMQLGPQQKVILTQTVGYPKK